MAKKITSAEAMQDLKGRKHQVTQSAAATMVKSYQAFRTSIAGAKKNGGALPANLPDLPEFITYNKVAIQELLKSDACTGLRIYPAINAENCLTLVLVGIDAEGENMVTPATVASKSTTARTTATGTTVVDEGQMSPPYPAPVKPL